VKFLVTCINKFKTIENDHVLQLLCIPLNNIQILSIGNLRLIKCFDFWIYENELPYRIENFEINNINELIGYVIKVNSIAGRVIKLNIINKVNTIEKLREYISKPIGIRYFQNYLIMGFNEQVYAIIRNVDNLPENIEELYYRKIIQGFLLYSTPKNFEKTRKIIEEKPNKKISIQIDGITVIKEKSLRC